MFFEPPSIFILAREHTDLSVVCVWEGGVGKVGGKLKLSSFVRGLLYSCLWVSCEVCVYAAGAGRQGRSWGQIQEKLFGSSGSFRGN